jgi:undecaprenyl-diphosphatase
MDFPELFKAILLGAIQGLTEFLPISSSGHLVIGSQLLDFEQHSVAFDVFLHLGSLLAVLLVFRKELMAMVRAPLFWLRGNLEEQDRVYLFWDLYIVIASIPAILVGLFLKDKVEGLFSSLPLVYSMLTVTAVLMLSSGYLQERDKKLGWFRCLLIGCAQACAIMPGLSRSGSTIFVGMLLGVNREVVARFSFIMSVPVILGAAVLQVGDIAGQPFTGGFLLNLVGGTVAAAISGYFAIVLLLDIVRRNRLQYFGYYCLVVALTGFGLLFFL